MNKKQRGSLSGASALTAAHQPADLAPLALLSQDGSLTLKAGAVDSLVRAADTMLCPVQCAMPNAKLSCGGPRGTLRNLKVTTVRGQPASFGAKVFIWADAVVQNWAHL